MLLEDLIKSVFVIKAGFEGNGKNCEVLILPGHKALANLLVAILIDEGIKAFTQRCIQHLGDGMSWQICTC